MTTSINTAALINTCDTLARRCSSIAGTQHGSAWLFRQLMDFFEKSAAAISVTIPIVMWNIYPGDGYATICRDGKLYMHRQPEFDLG